MKNKEIEDEEDERQYIKTKENEEDKTKEIEDIEISDYKCLMITICAYGAFSIALMAWANVYVAWGVFILSMVRIFRMLISMIRKV